MAQRHPRRAEVRQRRARRVRGSRSVGPHVFEKPGALLRVLSYEIDVRPLILAELQRSISADLRNALADLVRRGLWP